MGQAPDYDLITVGGGLGGAALARAMAARGARTLVLEREPVFRDRVRGEVLQPWGVAESRRLGLEPLLLDGCGHVLRWTDMLFGDLRVVHRDLVATTAPRAPWLAFYHPAMQETVLAAAAAAGAEVRRGARVHGVEPGTPAAVICEQGGHAERLTARLVVGADGRTSAVRRWAGFTTRQDPPRIRFSGLLLDGVSVADDTGHVVFNPTRGRLSLLFPQGRERVRAYVACHVGADPAPARMTTVAEFFTESQLVGVNAAWYAHARPAGPLATFDGADVWVEHPYRDGVALIGDAAATSDPTWGQGMSLTLRDVRTLSELLLASDDWDAAGHAYAREHDRYYAIIHTVDGWYADFFIEIGPEADARRARALPLIAADDTRIPEVPFSGPELPADDATRRRFFGEA